ncbi:helix-turn-helix domain-containing protein [Cryobacterium tagatosivorans]|uniref:XRE family transcriptional regulator n=1 Tax=Cryobacterium tagatosivorans TaxID=1259199 RepID=A0A4R8UET0_9MICO|nr:XRE family transcriptional regulator [Cryobacterium tagatosivorans]
MVSTGDWTQARVAERLHVSRATISKWVCRYPVHWGRYIVIGVRCCAPGRWPRCGSQHRAS